MELVTLNINGNNIDFLDQPDGLDKIQIGYDRIPTYNGFKTEAKVTMTFYCGSGYDALKAEYERAFVDGIGYIEIAETCNNIETKFKFNLDFSKYKQTTDTIQVGLNESSEIDDLLDSLEIEKTIEDTIQQEVYVRNIETLYNYESLRETLKYSTENKEGIPGGFTSPLPFNYFYALNLKTETAVNQLEDGYELYAETIELDGYGSNVDITTGVMVEQIVGGATTYPTLMDVPTYEPQPIFENALQSGRIKIDTNGSTELVLKSINGIDFLGQIENFSEWFIVGRTYERPAYTKRLVLSGNVSKVQNPLANNLTNIPLTNTIGFAQNNFEVDVAVGHSVWHFYTFDVRTVDINNDPNNPIYDMVFMFKDIDITIERNVKLEFLANQNTLNGVFNNNDDVLTYSSAIKAYKASDIANQLIPNLTYNELEGPKFNDLFISRGDYLRNKINADKIRLSPAKFFAEIEKITACGIGTFYNNPLINGFQLRCIEDFYTNTIFKTYNFEYDDVTITIAENMLYKSIEIGYNDAKDSIEELHGKNVYQIEGVVKGKNIYNKVSEWIASKFLIKKALGLGTSGESKEYDNNYFVFSIDTANNATISDNSSSATIGKDLVFENNISNVRGLNRKYASIFNLRRHFYKWGFGLRKGKTNLSTTKSANNQKEVKYQDGFGYINYPSFIPASNDITTTELDVNDNFIPHYIEFSVVMNITEFSNLRKNWYDMIQVNVDSDVYYGNIVSADFSEGVCKFKLIGREQ